MTPADRLRSLVKEATPENWGRGKEAEARVRAYDDALDWLESLAPLLAELVADMAEAASAFRAEHPPWSPDDFDEYSIGEALQGDESPGYQLDLALARFAALFPEDTA